MDDFIGNGCDGVDDDFMTFEMLDSYSLTAKHVCLLSTYVILLTMHKDVPAMPACEIILYMLVFGIANILRGPTKF